MFEKQGHSHMNQSVTAPQQSEQVEFDTLFKNARKEALIILLVWLVALLWTVPYCYIYGNMLFSDTNVTTADNISLTCGIPTWVFWGVAFPWGMADLFTIWFCLFYMKDDDLGEDAGDTAVLAEDFEAPPQETIMQEGGQK